METEINYHYIIETGDYKKKENATTMMGAAISAFILKPPKNPGVLTRIKRDGGNCLTGEEYVWHYIDTMVLLKKAGFEVEKKKSPQITR